MALKKEKRGTRKGTRKGTRTAPGGGREASFTLVLRVADEGLVMGPKKNSTKENKKCILDMAGNGAMETFRLRGVWHHHGATSEVVGKASEVECTRLGPQRPVLKIKHTHTVEKGNEQSHVCEQRESQRGRGSKREDY